MISRRHTNCKCHPMRQFVLIILLLPFSAFAQDVSVEYIDNVYRGPVSESIDYEIYLPYGWQTAKSVTEATDIVRVISLADSINMPLENLWLGDNKDTSLSILIVDALQRNKLTAYANINNTQYSNLSKEDVTNKLHPVISGDKQITHYMIFETWAFDKNEGRLKVGLRGIAPCYMASEKECKPLFWLQYVDVRNLVQLYTLQYKTKKGYHKYMVKDFFEERLFTSKLIYSSK